MKIPFLKEFDSAIMEYKMASKSLPLAYLYLGNVSFQKNEFEKAEGYYRKAITKDPQNADVYNNLAWLYYTKKRDSMKQKLLRKRQGNSIPQRGGL